jgi:hypothetical protein
VVEEVSGEVGVTKRELWDVVNVCLFILYRKEHFLDF